MSAQEHAHKRTDDTDDVPAEEAEAAAHTSSDTAARDADVDSLLDEIDDVLETNAEEFVAAFVQKGGQ